jgi:hypothetical protein
VLATSSNAYELFFLSYFASYHVASTIHQSLIIGLSATPSNKAVCIAAGMDGCIQKRFQAEELLTIVESFIEHNDHDTSFRGMWDSAASGGGIWDSGASG